MNDKTISHEGIRKKLLPIYLSDETHIIYNTRTFTKEREKKIKTYIAT